MIVKDLQVAIKNELPIKLAAFDLPALKLYKISVDGSDMEKAKVKVKALAQDLSTLTELNPLFPLSEALALNPSTLNELNPCEVLPSPSGAPSSASMKIDILVIIPEGESIDSRACGVLFMAGGIDAAWTQFNSRRPRLIGYRTRPWSTLQSNLLTSLTPK